jgi:hypothetical protein
MEIMGKFGWNTLKRLKMNVELCCSRFILGLLSVFIVSKCLQVRPLCEMLSLRATASGELRDRFFTVLTAHVTRLDPTIINTYCTYLSLVTIEAPVLLFFSLVLLPSRSDPD